MRICLVSAFPPSQAGLSEYGLHIAQELRRNPFLSLTVLADQIPGPHEELDGFSVHRCWSYDDPASVGRILGAIREQRPDVVWFNLLFSTFGRNPLIAFWGLLTPLLSRLSGRYTHVTLHHLMDTVDLQDAGVRHARTYRWGGAVATRMLLLSNSVSVLMPRYRQVLSEKYGRDNVHVRSHGILTRTPEYPDFSRRGNPEHRILAFGKWGTYKRLELMIDAFQRVAEVLPTARLVIAGGDHPQSAGYVESMKKKYTSNPNITFTGYVQEDRLSNLFQSSSVAVMPYSSSTGCSGVAHLACAYGVPIVCADLPDFRQMADGEELAIEFYKPGDAQDLADGLVRLLTNPEKQHVMATQNFSSALHMTMPNVVQKYLRHFELDQRVEALRQVTRFRRLPNWIRARPLVAKFIARKSSRWVRGPIIPRSSRNRGSLEYLLNCNLHGGGELDRTRSSMDRDRIAVGNGRGTRSARSDARSSAGNGTHSHAEESNKKQNPDPLSARAAEDTTSDSERQQPAELDWNRFPLLGQIYRGPGNGSNGKSGGTGPRAGSDGSGRERTAQSAGNSAAGERDGTVERT